jgi:hypothetical protein
MRARKKPVAIEFRDATPGEVISTMEGAMTAKQGDVIITGVKGEVYPCDREIFLATYEPDDEDATGWFAEAIGENIKDTLRSKQ